MRAIEQGPGGLTIGWVFDNGDVLFVDDEGLLHPATVAFSIRARPDGQPMMSHGVLTGRDHLDDTLPPEMSTAQLAKEIEWLDVKDALSWFRTKADEAAVSVQARGGVREVMALWGDLLRNMEGEDGYRPDRDERLISRL